MTRRLPNRVMLQHMAVRATLAGGFALAALFASDGWRAGAAEPATDVWVTAHDIAPGTTLAAGDVVLRRWPADSAAGWLGRARSPVGLTAGTRLAAGTPLDEAMVSATAGSGLGAALRPGRRAMSIAVTPAGGLAGFLAPGDHVDVLLTQPVGKRRSVQTLVTDLAVLGVDQSGDAAPGDGPVPPGLVTLEVSPRQAEALAVAAELGSLSLVLRGPGRSGDREGSHGPRWDSEVTGLPASLFAEAAPPPPRDPAPAAAAPPPAPGGVTIHYGLPAAAEAAAASGPAK